MSTLPVLFWLEYVKMFERYIVILIKLTLSTEIYTCRLNECLMSRSRCNTIYDESCL